MSETRESEGPRATAAADGRARGALAVPSPPLLLVSFLGQVRCVIAPRLHGARQEASRSCPRACLPLARGLGA